jgi:hypothetical protein
VPLGAIRAAYAADPSASEAEDSSAALGELLLVRAPLRPRFQSAHVLETRRASGDDEEEKRGELSMQSVTVADAPVPGMEGAAAILRMSVSADAPVDPADADEMAVELSLVPGVSPQGAPLLAGDNESDIDTSAVDALLGNVDGDDGGGASAQGVDTASDPADPMIAAGASESALP